MGRSNVVTDVFNYIDTHDNDSDVCWEWTGSLSGRDGRPYISIDGKKHLAYRIVYKLFHGELEDGKVVRHKCDNPKCCNPTHLESGTRSENELDKYRRDRSGYPHEVIKEMNRLFKLGMSYSAIKRHLDAKFEINISISGIGNVFRGDRRKGQVKDD